MCVVTDTILSASSSPLPGPTSKYPARDSTRLMCTMSWCLCIHLRLQQWHILLWHWGWNCEAAAWLTISGNWSVAAIQQLNHKKLTIWFTFFWAVASCSSVFDCRRYLHRITYRVISWACTWQSRTTKKPWWWSWVVIPRFLPRLGRRFDELLGFALDWMVCCNHLYSHHLFFVVFTFIFLSMAM